VPVVPAALGHRSSQIRPSGDVVAEGENAHKGLDYVENLTDSPSQSPVA
jgi:hypothetical protein